MNVSAARQVWKTPTTTNTASEKTLCKFRLFYQTLVFILSGFYGELQPPQQIFPRQWHLQYFTSCTCEISGSLTGEDLLLNKVKRMSHHVSSGRIYLFKHQLDAKFCLRFWIYDLQTLLFKPQTDRTQTQRAWLCLTDAQWRSASGGYRFVCQVAKKLIVIKCNKQIFCAQQTNVQSLLTVGSQMTLCVFVLLNDADCCQAWFIDIEREK